MKKNIFILAIFSLLISFTSCNEAKKNESTETTTEATEAVETEEPTISKSESKVEKLEAPEFNMKMIELRIYNIVDVRTPQEFAQASIKKAENIDFNEDSFESELNQLEKDKPLFIYCKSGGRSAKAVEKAKELGFERIIELDGGMDAWKAAKIETAHSI
ncbi:Rhodanese-related sulfurtransferase [Bernardetia litoralis DSM 6794]|uniref:Rhodanese-related sulfurtransferase n=1 Tax=Bernardetia litoralis (strain ATCC 23117 / DSM 6794 / NBRC 15988 / NCIMB 1366 / Fx l1 / Sio-4) TaxID=880071 RepID=I4AI38_BERLS|nr:rhodanese-like domain-containing protein [Bernardetia litoralis]AFM03623.1 Rhodanese-related sulfurtransferase [Bernardetia litoralis DSM 6794]